MRMNYETGPKVVTKLYYAVSKVKEAVFESKIASHKSHEIIYIIQGEIKLTCNNKTFSIKEGECFFIKGLTEHEYINTTDGELLFFNIAYHGILPDALTNKVITLDQSTYDSITRLKEVSLPPMNTAKAELAACTLAEFILRLNMQYTKTAPKPVESSTRNRHRYNSKLLNQAIDIITKRYAEDLRIGQVSSQLCTSSSNLRTLFRKETGHTFTHHLQSARIEAAKELLYHGTENINSIAIKTGYHSLPAFFKVFRRFTGTTPSEFVKNWEFIHKKNK